MQKRLAEMLAFFYFHKNIVIVMTPERYKKVKECMQKRQPDMTVVMENVHKAHNLAAIARTCDAVGVSEIHATTQLDEITLTQNASSGSDRWLEVKCYKHVDEIYSNLKNNKFQILVAHFDDNAIDFREIDYTIPTAIVVGQELEVIKAELRDMMGDFVTTFREVNPKK